MHSATLISMISFVYFDLGGVVIDDFSGNAKWNELKRELGVTKETNAGFEDIWARYEAEICLDRDVQTLVPILTKELKVTLPIDYSLLRGFTNRFYANPFIWPVLKYVQKRSRLGLLTNMYPGMFTAIQKRKILPNVTWNVVIDSSIELLQKPDERVFALAEARAGVPAAEILFVDNGAEHIQAAEALGWQTFFYDASDHQASSKALQQFMRQQAFPHGNQIKQKSMT